MYIENTCQKPDEIGKKQLFLVLLENENNEGDLKPELIFNRDFRCQFLTFLSPFQTLLTFVHRHFQRTITSQSGRLQNMTFGLQFQGVKSSSTLSGFETWKSPGFGESGRIDFSEHHQMYGYGWGASYFFKALISPWSEQLQSQRIERIFIQLFNLNVFRKNSPMKQNRSAKSGIHIPFLTMWLMPALVFSKQCAKWAASCWNMSNTYLFESWLTVIRCLFQGTKWHIIKFWRSSPRNFEMNILETIPCYFRCPMQNWELYLDNTETMVSFDKLTFTKIQIVICWYICRNGSSARLF